MSKNLLWLLVAAAFVMPLGCSSEEDDPAPAPPAPFGSSALAVGYTSAGTAIVMTTGDMLEWTAVTGTGIPGQPRKVVKVPTLNRFVTIVNMVGANVNDEIWYNDNGGEGAWTMASYGATEANLDARHRETTGTDDEWTLNDIFFVDVNTGYAVGDYGILLATTDGGLTWKDLNLYQATFPVTGAGYQVIDLGTSIPAAFIPGAGIQNLPAATKTGTIISVDPSDSTIVVSTSAAFTTTPADSIQVGAAGTPVLISSVNNILYRYNTWTAYSVYGTSTVAGVHTVYIGVSYGNNIEGIWRIVTDAPATPAARVFTFTGPIATQTGGLGVGGSSVNGLFFFDAITGVAGTNDGVWYTTNGTVWTQFTTTDTDDFYSFGYSNEILANTGHLYSVNGYTNIPGRVAVTYTAGTPGTWAFDTTAGWIEHATAANVDMWYVDGSSSIFASGSKMFVLDGYNTGEYGWCPDLNTTLFNDGFWTDTTELSLGGTTANGDNAAYNKGILDGTSAPVGSIVSMCRR